MIGIKNKPVALWLFTVAELVFWMVIVGAITRLSGSGLSMVEWRPLIGALPPLTETEWLRVFDLYKQSPEYQKVNDWMVLSDFKHIFFWEWFHRLLGRLIGLAYTLPLIYFWMKKKLHTEDRPAFIGLLILGGLQGLMGWYMVQSGLVDEPAVSHYRLAAHLGLAFLIFCCLLWMGFKYVGFQRRPHSSLYMQSWITLGFLIMTIFWGAYVAGLDAGLVYNEFPMMGDSLFPPDMWFFQPLWVNLFEHIPAVQFTHRWLAMITALLILAFGFRAAHYGYRGIVFTSLIVMVFIQVGLGIATLLSQVSTPIAVMHQGGALILLGLLVTCLYVTRPEKKA